MTSRTRSIAMLAANPAYASIFCTALEAERGIAMPVFSSLPALSTFLRLSPVDIAVLNIDAPWIELVRIAHELRHAPRVANPLLEVILLTAAAPLTGAGTSGIAAVLAKPVTPAQLLETIDRLAAPRMARDERPRHVPSARPRPTGSVAAPRERVGNVIPLFGNRSQL